jgi:hypothetical protein
MALTITDIEADVFILSVSDRLDALDVEHYLNRFDTAITAARPFGVLVSYSGAAPRKDRAAHQLERAWLGEHKHAMTAWCFGMALASNGRLLAALSKIAMKGLGTRLLGCPCNAFASEAAAQSWLVAQRSSHGSLKVRSAR